MAEVQVAEEPAVAEVPATEEPEAEEPAAEEPAAEEPAAEVSAVVEESEAEKAKRRSNEKTKARAAKAGKLLKGGKERRGAVVGLAGVVHDAAGKKANELFKKGWLAELRISNYVETAIDKYGGVREGADFVQKDTGSMAEKIERGEKPINDSIRYTATFDKDALTEGTLGIFRELEKRGFKKVGVRNTFGTTRSYWGINTNWHYDLKVPGLPNPMIEVQFHTPESFKVKQETNHPLYETWRKSKDPELDKQMLANTKEAIGELPKGIREIKDYPPKQDPAEEETAKRADYAEKAAKKRRGGVVGVGGFVTTE